MVKQRRSGKSTAETTPASTPPASGAMSPDTVHTPLLHSATRSNTISHAESLEHVPWQTDNDYILSGYRRQLRSWKSLAWSAIGYLHNETVNIHSHFLGALSFVSLIPIHLFSSHFSPARQSHPPAPHAKASMTLYLGSAVTCLSLSAWFHFVQCRSRGACELAHRGDYIGIVVLIVGSIVPSLYYAFHCQPVLQAVYISGIVAAGIGSAYVVLSPHHRAHRWHRTLVFIGLGLSAVIPVVHVLCLKGLQQTRVEMSLDLVVAGGGCYIFGAVLYAARIPESLSPGTFDLIGSSHQIFHLFVLAGATCQYYALLGMIWGRAAVGPACT